MEDTTQEAGTYLLKNFDTSVPSQKVQFYEKAEDGSTLQDGTTLEEMLRVSIERLQDLNGRFPCRENSIAITKMQEAKMWLDARTLDRQKRGVEGKLEA